jgi:ATP-dependent Lhr-like helicase
MAFELLSEPIRKYIRDQGWESLRPIQTGAIQRILSTDLNYILASRTASGKTEAAFLPILSRVDFKQPGVQVLYISPLIALINDQFQRVEELCEYLDVTVTKWHGEANRSAKNTLLKMPQGIVLITPESLEAMFVNKPYDIKHLFTDLKYVVIDEIHSFIGTDRGIQLKSLLSRIQRINTSAFKVVGLSATLGDFEEAKKFTGQPQNTKVLLDKTAKEIEAQFRFYKGNGVELPLEMLKDLYRETSNNKALIFPNSRGRAEEVAVKLLKISDKVGGHKNYFSHHSSVDREVREYVEHFAKTNKRENFCICCTSTLELGIDIGSVDEVVQIDATFSIASLIQRVGRSGRRDGEKSVLHLYATSNWDLLQSLACWLLYREGFIEPPASNNKPYDLLLHQALSIVKGHSGIRIAELLKQLRENYAFTGIEWQEIEEIVSHLIEIDFLEKLQDEVIIGIEGEKIVNSREFYSVFKTEENFKVVNAGNTIGEIPFSPQVREDENILLAARIWKIKSVDFDSKKIHVVKAVDGRKPKFFGGGGNVHPRIRQKMMDILFSTEVYPELNAECVAEISRMRKDFSVFAISDTLKERPLLAEDQKVTLFTFAGSQVNKTIYFLLQLAGVKMIFDDQSSSFEVNMSKDEFIKYWENLIVPMEHIDEHVAKFIRENPAAMGFSKWGESLPEKYKVHLIKNRAFDFADLLIKELVFNL